MIDPFRARLHDQRDGLLRYQVESQTNRRDDMEKVDSTSDEG